MSAYRAHLFSAEITGGELARLRGSGPHGTAADGERTYVEVTSFGRIRRERLVDWAALGLISAVLLGIC